jgi:hypothetical protein
MPAVITIDQARGIRFTTLTGVVSPHEILDAYSRVAGDPALSNVTRSLVDVREGSVAALTSKDVRAYAQLPALPRQSEMRLAIVATDSAAYGVSRMYSMLRESTHAGETRVFRDYDEAVVWLLDDAPKPP